MSLYAVNQTQVQRLLTVKNLKRSQLAMIINWPILSALSLSTGFCGLCLYYYYSECDPVLQGRIESRDQLMPLFVVDEMGKWPGLSGIFVSGIFSASLSTISAAMNSLAAVTLEDYFKVIPSCQILRCASLTPSTSAAVLPHPSEAFRAQFHNSLKADRVRLRARLHRSRIYRAVLGRIAAGVVHDIRRHRRTTIRLVHSGDVRAAGDAARKPRHSKAKFPCLTSCPFFPGRHNESLRICDIFVVPRIRAAASGAENTAVLCRQMRCYEPHNAVQRHHNA